MIVRALLGLVLAAAVSIIARRTRSLSTSGAIAATGVGCIAVATGWTWGALLLGYFVLSTLVSRVGRAEKERRTATMVAKGGERDAAQVLANGGVFAAAGLGMLALPAAGWTALAAGSLAAGSLAAAAADTWATEIGTLKGGEPRSIMTGERLAAGTSGGVTLIGSLGAVGGAATIAVLAVALGWPMRKAAFVFAGGVAGAFLDSILGATVQSRRWCDRCQRETERWVHDCGTRTDQYRGLTWMDNDVVNFISAAIGGLIAALLTL